MYIYIDRYIYISIYIDGNIYIYTCTTLYMGFGPVIACIGLMLQFCPCKAMFQAFCSFLLYAACLDMT
jgi:hypothetical protein